MSYNGSGTFQINTSGQPVVAGTVISSTAFNALTADLATGLSTAITKDGQSTTTVRIPFAAGINSTLVTDSTSTTTGSIITGGGVGIAKALYVGTNANVAGTLGVTGVATFSAAPIYTSLTASSAVATDASKALVSVTNTGTGNNVLATSPTLVTPILGTPQSGTVTNLTGTASININGTVGATTASSGAFTTLSATGVTTVQAGTVSLPAITTSGDTNTGIFFPAADTIAFAEGGAEAMRIDSSSRVLIGSTSSVGNANANNLELTNPAGSGVCGLTLNVNSASANTGNIYWRSNASNNSIQIVGDPITNYFAVATAGSERMRIDSSGNVLVGATSNIAAGAKIFAKGSGVGVAVGYGTGSAEYRHLYMNSGDGSLFFFNDTNYAFLSAAGAWTNASDARLKKNIVDIKYGLSDVLKAKPRSYQMNDIVGDFVGFVAQELQTVIPEVVTGDPEKQLGVDYGSLVAVAFKAIQEQQALITALTARITALESN